MPIYKFSDMTVDPHKYPWGYSTVIWTPADITTHFWIDAADAASITSALGKVSQWNDKSGYDFHVSQAVEASQPEYVENVLNGLPVVRFASNSLVNAAFNALGGASRATFFGVKSTTAPNGNTHPVHPRAGLISQQYQNTFRVYAGSQSARFAMDDTDFHIYSIEYDGNEAVSADRMRMGLDGTPQILTHTGTLSTALESTLGLSIGSAYSGANAYPGDFAEYIIIAGAVTEANRQKFEGYLAHKWGLAGNLPSSPAHPYKDAAP